MPDFFHFRVAWKMGTWHKLSLCARNRWAWRGSWISCSPSRSEIPLLAWHDNPRLISEFGPHSSFLLYSHCVRISIPMCSSLRLASCCKREHPIISGNIMIDYNQRNFEHTHVWWFHLIPAAELSRSFCFLDWHLRPTRHHSPKFPLSCFSKDLIENGHRYSPRWGQD